MVGTPGFIFSTTGQGAPTYEELQRQRTILAHLLAQKRGPPKNIGEGLTALGEGFGDLMYGLQTRGAEKASADYVAKNSGLPAAPPAAAPYVPPSETPPPAATPPAVTPPPGPGAEISVDQGAVGGDTPVSATAAPVVTENTASTPPPDTNIAEGLAADAGARARGLINPAAEGSTVGVPAPRPAGTANVGPTAPVVPVAPPPPDRPPTGASVEAIVGPQSAIADQTLGAARPAVVPPPSAARQATADSTAPAANGPLDYLHQYGGHATVVQDGRKVHVHPGTTGTYGALNPELAGRLVAAGKAFEAETGKKPRYGEASRGEDVQKIYWEESGHGTKYAAAPPGRSRHQHGEAMDLPPGEFRDWLYAGNMHKFGLNFPVKGDAPHVQMNPRYAGPAFSGGDTQTAAVTPNKRDAITAAVLTGQTPLTTADREQEARSADVMGIRGPAPANVSFPQTAARGDVSSDIAPSGVSGLAGGNTSLNIGDTAQARRDAIARTISPPPPAPAPAVGPGGEVQPPVGAPTAQRASASVSDAPPVGVPPAGTTIPRSQLVQPEGAGNVPQQGPARPRPPDPVLVQPDAAYVQQLDRIANDPRLPLAAQKRAYDTLDDYRKQVQHENDKRTALHQVYLKQWLDEDTKRRDYSTQLDNEKKVRDLRNQGFYEITPEQAKKFYPGGEVPKGQAIWLDRDGKPVLGPVGTNINMPENRQETAEAAARGTAGAKAERELIDSAKNAQADIRTLNQSKVVLEKIKTGALQPGVSKIGAVAKDMGIPSDVLKSMGLNPEMIADQQVFTALSNKGVLGHLGAGGMPTQNFSNTDRGFIERIETSLGDDLLSNKIKLEIRLADRRAEMEKFQEWAKFRKDPANRNKDGSAPSFTDFEFMWNDKVQQKDVLGHLAKDAEEIINRARPPAPPAAAAPAPAAPATGLPGTPVAPAAVPAGAPGPVRAKGPDGKFYVPRNGQWVPE